MEEAGLWNLRQRKREYEVEKKGSGKTAISGGKGKPERCFQEPWAEKKGIEKSVQKHSWCKGWKKREDKVAQKKMKRWKKRECPVEETGIFFYFKDNFLIKCTKIKTTYNI